MSAPLLQLQQLCFQPQTQYLLQNIAAQFEAGQFYAVLGANGAGKTTLLRLLAGLIKPSSGRVLLYGRDLHDYDRRQLARRISYLPQTMPVDFAFTAQELVAQGRYPHLQRWRALSGEDHAQIEQALQMTDTQHLARRLVTQLSGGERQRVLLARCLCSQSEILLLDEPVANLDIRHTLEFLQRCQTLQQQGKTLIMSLHDINQASRYAQHVLLLQDGHLFAQGATQAVLTAENIQAVFQVHAQHLPPTSQRFEFYV